MIYQETPFDLVYESDAKDAGQLAQAFISARDLDELHAILRYLHNTDPSAGLGCYLVGCHFIQWQDEMHCEILPECFEELRELAHAYKDSCLKTPGLWKV